MNRREEFVGKGARTPQWRSTRRKRCCASSRCARYRARSTGSVRGRRSGPSTPGPSKAPASWATCWPSNWSRWAKLSLTYNPNWARECRSHRHSEGRAYYDRKLKEDKTNKEALRYEMTFGPIISAR